MIRPNQTEEGTNQAGIEAGTTKIGKLLINKETQTITCQKWHTGNSIPSSSGTNGTEANCDTDQGTDRHTDTASFRDM